MYIEHKPVSLDSPSTRAFLFIFFPRFRITNPINKMQTSSSSSSSTPNSPSHSSITLHSLVASSTDSSSSFQSSFPSSSTSPSRCFGLNLLVKAIHQVTAGSVVGVPYIQRRNVTRRKRPIQFNNLILTTTALLPRSGSKSKSKSKPKAKRQRRVNMAMPSKYRDSVLQPLTLKPRIERSSSDKIIGD